MQVESAPMSLESTPYADLFRRSPSRDPFSRESFVRNEPPAPDEPVYDPLRVLSKPPNPVPSYSFSRPSLVERAPGLLEDGRFTIDHPLVLEHLLDPAPLATAKEALSVGKALWALAALRIALNPEHPKYDHFWGSWEMTIRTSEFIAGQNISKHAYCPHICHLDDLGIRHAVRNRYLAWGKAKGVLRPNGKAVAEQEPKRNLRKRKGAEAPVDPAPDADAPPPHKRTRTATAQTPRRANNAPLKPSPLSRSVVLPATSAEPGSPSPASEEPKIVSVPVRASLRPKKKSVHAREAEEHAAAAAAEEAPAATHAPIRQSVRRAVSSGASSSASSSTAVSSDAPGPSRSRSGSASSATTAVDVTAALQADVKGKGKAKAAPAPAPAPRNTRARSRASETPAPSELTEFTPAPETDTASVVDEPIEPEKTSRPKRARKPTGTRKSGRK